MYDLDIDPYESNNIQNDDAYSSYKSYIEGRVTYWQTKLTDPKIPDWSNANASFEACGAVCPWLDSDDDVNDNNDDVDVIFTYDKAPHVIMVVIDDWGWNDFGMRSNYLSWTTPNIDTLATEGIVASNFFVHYMCVPTRGALLTGRYALRLGLWKVTAMDAELLPSELLLSQELKSAGYRTALVGKWHLGMSKSNLLPTARGFESFYGLYGGYVDYWTKTYEGFIDLHDDNTESKSIVTDSVSLDDQYHNAFLLQSKAEEVMKTHVEDYPYTPLFLLYSMQLVHYPWEAPTRFLSRCEVPSTNDAAYDGKLYNYCGMNLLLDEAIANLTCSMKSTGIYANSILMILSDNGGEKTILGNSYPLRGHKGSLYRGGLSSTLILHSSTLINEKMKGSEYKGLMHVTDIFPTVMHLATNGQWKGSMGNVELDGFDMWDYLNGNLTSPRTEIVHFVDTDEFSVQYNSIKLNAGGEAPNEQEDSNFVFTKDLNPQDAYYECESDLSISETIYESSSNWREIFLQSIPFYVLTSLLLLVSFVVLWVVCTTKSTRHDQNELQKLYDNNSYNNTFDTFDEQYEIENK